LPDARPGVIFIAMAESTSRIEFAVAEIDRALGEGYAAGHAELVAAVVIAASLDWGAMVIAAALSDDETVLAPAGLARSLHVPR
jgi:hypothetical protein